jgi:hypothetical protein
MCLSRLLYTSRTLIRFRMASIDKSSGSTKSIMDYIFSGMKSLDTSDLMTVINSIIVEMETHSKKTVNTLTKNNRNKSNAKKNEDADVKEIVDAINNPESVRGAKLLSAFKEETGLNIESARQGKGDGGRSKHYDFEIQVSGIWYKVEHKGSLTYKDFKYTSPPWIGGVQFYNGTAKNFTLGRIYARQWYDRYIASGNISEKYGITSSIPDYETWFAKDAMRQGDPTTPFGLELRSKFRGEDKKGGCFDERNEMTSKMVFSDTDMETFKTEVLSIAQSALKEKDYWLQINGDINNEFYCKWSPQLIITTITDARPITCSDVHFEFDTDMGFPINTKLRWGKGQGLSNLRIDLK